MLLPSLLSPSRPLRKARNPAHIKALTQHPFDFIRQTGKHTQRRVPALGANLKTSLDIKVSFSADAKLLES